MANIFQNTWKKISNVFWLPTDTSSPAQNTTGEAPITSAYMRNFGGSTDMDHNLNVFRAPIDIPRLKQDMTTWRQSITEAERQIYPYRYMQQTMYMDIMLEPHLVACWNRRLEMTLQKKFKITSKKTGKEYEKWTSYFKKPFFNKFIQFALDARLYGYSLISLGDIMNDEFVNTVILRRGNINPDSYQFTAVPRTTKGIDFRESPYSDWMIWVPTLNDHTQ